MQTKKSAPSAPLGGQKVNIDPLERVSARTLAVHHENLMLKRTVKGLTALSAVLLLVVVFFVAKGPTTYFFATSPSGTILPLTPLNEPMLRSPQVIGFATEAVTETLSIDFANYRKQLSKSSEYFQSDAFSALTTEMQSSGFLPDLVTNLYVSSVVATSAPIVVAEGKDPAGVYTWHIQMPIAVRLQNKSGVKTQNFSVNVYVKRALATEKIRNLAVSKLVLA
jgi:intracellular multiplication protein IcmL